MPGPLGASSSEGTNALIASGAARACLGADEVARAIGLVAPAAEPSADPLLQAVAAGPLDLDELARRVRVDRSALRSRLVSRVFSGAVVDQGGGRFARGPG